MKQARTTAPKARVKIQTHVSHELRKRVSAYCAAHAISESSFVKTAVTDALDGKVNDLTLLTQRLDRMARYLGRVDGGIEFLSEGFDEWVRQSMKTWPPHPSVPKETTDKWHADFHVLVGKRLRGPTKLLERIQQDAAAAAARQAAPASASKAPASPQLPLPPPVPKAAAPAVGGTSPPKPPVPGSAVASLPKPEPRDI